MGFYLNYLYSSIENNDVEDVVAPTLYCIKLSINHVAKSSTKMQE